MDPVRPQTAEQRSPRLRIPRLVDRSSSDPIGQRPRADCGQKQDPGGWIGSPGIDTTRPVTEEIWFVDEARVGQKNKITRRWAKRGTDSIGIFVFGSGG